MLQTEKLPACIANLDTALGGEECEGMSRRANHARWNAREGVGTIVGMLSLNHVEGAFLLLVGSEALGYARPMFDFCQRWHMLSLTFCLVEWQNKLYLSLTIVVVPSLSGQGLCVSAPPPPLPTVHVPNRASSLSRCQATCQ